MKERVGDRIAVLAKLNMADGVPGGLWLDESIEVARMLEADGVLDAIVLTGGSSFENPMYLFRGEAPIAEMAETFPPKLRVGFKLVAKRFFVTYPFEEAYFLPYARQFRAALDMPLVLLGGVNRPETVQAALDEGFDFVQMGRALFARAGPRGAVAEGRRAREPLHPLQQVHAHHLSGHALRSRRPRRSTGPPAHVRSARGGLAQTSGVVAFVAAAAGRAGARIGNGCAPAAAMDRRTAPTDIAERPGWIAGDQRKIRDRPA